MSSQVKPLRILDPIHGLIHFDDYPFHPLLNAIINSRIFQRLRGIRQLGLTDLVYPGACHVRFSHSLGVAHIARVIVQRVHRQIGADFTERLQEQVILAALLHDIGHGPYSHVFERVVQGQQNHEVLGFTLLQSPELIEIFSKFDRLADLDAVTKLWQGQDISATVRCLGTIVSGALDADRLDYLHRDQVMTGSFQGRFDWPWLLDNIVWSDKGLALGHRAIYAAEEYLLARAHLYQTVYFHRTVRGAEAMLVRLLRRFRGLCQSGEITAVAELDPNHPLMNWYQHSLDSRNIDDFLCLDDGLIQHLFTVLHSSKDLQLSNYAQRLRYRRLYHCYEASQAEMEHLMPVLDTPTKRQAFEEKTAIWTDIVDFTAYDNRQPIYIEQGKEWSELAEASVVVQALQQPVRQLRLYYENADDIKRILS